MRRLLALLCALSLAAALTGCGEPASPLPEEADPAPTDSPLPVTPEESEAAPTEELPALPEDAEEGASVEFIRELPITVDSGRTLRLQLHCRAEASGYGTWTYGVGTIDVLEGETLLQTISVADGIYAALAEEGLDSFGEDGWTHCEEALYMPEVLDLNFDGSQDIRLMEFLGTVNGAYLHWLWDGEAAEFVYAFELAGYGLTVDHDAQQLITESRGDWGQYYTDHYAYDETGALRHVKQIQEDFAAEGATEDQPVVRVYEDVDGAWVQTQ